MGKKITVYTERKFVADEYPFHDEGTYYTQFYEKPRAGSYFTQCIASVTEQEKKKICAMHLNCDAKDIELMSRKTYRKLNIQQSKTNNNGNN